MKRVLFDLEGDGLFPSKIHCFCWTDLDNSNEIYSTTDYDTIRSVIRSAEVLVGHNIIRFDVPVLERLIGPVKSKLIDTLPISWYLYPDKTRHGLAEWGEDFGVPKPPIDDWENLSIEEYINRCTEDVKINLKLWKKEERYLRKLYNGEYSRIISYLMFKMDCAKEQERSGWKLDKPKTEKLLDFFEKEISEKTTALEGAMPQVPIIKKKSKPKKPFKKDGSLSAQGEKWFELLKQNNLPEDYEDEVEFVDGYEDPKASSNPQIKDWLFSLGWKPETFKYVREEDRSLRKIPQVRKDNDGVKVLCPSVEKLIDKEPALEYLKGLTVLSHRKSVVDGFLKNVDDKGYVQAKVAGLTNTLRFKHSVLVNIPGVFAQYGEDLRGCLIAPEGYELCGSDMSSLEDRTKQHYMWKYDPDYVREMQKPGFDPHLDLALSNNAVTQKQVDDFKSGVDKSIKPIRHLYKTGNYACVYGAQAEKLSRELGISKLEAQKLVDAYWERNWSVKKIAEDCETKVVNGQKWLFNPVSKLWYSLRHDKDRFSTLNQGTGAFCFDKWLYYVRSKRPQLTAQFHDEFIICIKKGHREECSKLLKWSINKVNEVLKLNRELDIDIQFGDRYADIH